MKKNLALILAALLLVLTLCSCGVANANSAYTVDPDEKSTLFDLISFQDDVLTVGGVAFTDTPEELLKKLPDAKKVESGTMPNEVVYILPFYDNALKANVQLAFSFVNGKLKTIHTLGESHAWDESVFPVVAELFEEYLPECYAELDAMEADKDVAETLKGYGYRKYAKEAFMEFDIDGLSTYTPRILFQQFDDPTGELRAEFEKQLPLKK